MVSYCSECGAKVELRFKFCPNCGSEINQSSISTDKNSHSKSIEVLVCYNCGDENALGSSVCQACGVRLDKSKQLKTTFIEEIKISSKSQSQKKDTKKNKKQVEKHSAEKISSDHKKLNPSKMFTFIGVSLAIVLLILIASGTVDLSSEPPKTLPNNQQETNSGIDLSTITKINELKNFVDKNPNNQDALLELANLRFDSGFFEEAVKNYNQYLNFNPKNANARIDLGVCYYNMQQYDKAESEILTALKYSPNHQTGYLNLGVINLAKQNMEKAKEWFSKTVEIDPNSEIGQKAKSLLQSH